MRFAIIKAIRFCKIKLERGNAYEEDIITNSDVGCFINGGMQQRY